MLSSMVLMVGGVRADRVDLDENAAHAFGQSGGRMSAGIFRDAQGPETTVSGNFSGQAQDTTVLPAPAARAGNQLKGQGEIVGIAH